MDKELRSDRTDGYPIYAAIVWTCPSENGTQEKFDVVLFFHHRSDYLKLVKELPKKIKDGGIVVFASEPITEAFPVPWGVRLDGVSLWSTRRFKWLGLAFKESGSLGLGAGFINT